ncbi:DUF6044 family protein [Virgibacillus ihumii]|uniref:DUF6044 family protein n=1 Tax=Virgibacillus ihumii TaxID=2686091 RepID=UPI001FEC90C5|nr:DUF6044 family protein [Virgibacillus ihumii]
MSKAISGHKLILLACLIIAAYLMPYLILGEDTHIRVHDNLDSNIVWYKLLVESGQFFSTGTLPNVINGLPRSTLASPFDIVVWLYVLFEPITAYTIGQAVMRFAAFFGMYLLLRRWIRQPWITVGTALGFALLPYWPSGLLSIAGLPLALHIFLNIRKHGWNVRKYNWVILFLLPFFSSFILTFVFFLGLIGLLWLIDRFRLHKFNWPFFTAIAGMTVLYLAKNYILIYGMFFSDGFTSHRENLNLGHNNLTDTFELFADNFINGHTHDMAVQTYIIIPVIGLAFLVAARHNIKPRLLTALFLFNAFLSLWYAFWYWEGWRIVKENFMIANTFNFSRIHFLDPMIWYICFALALWILWRHLPFGKVLVSVLMVVQLGILIGLNEEIKYSSIDTPTFAEFYSVDLFDDIQEYIGKDQSEYRVVSIAMHPTIAQYNGFFTLDTYNNSFPLSYKQKFRKIIAPELEKNKTLKNYYDTWGSRLYMYVAELGKHYLFTKQSDEVIDNLEINTSALRKLGGDYVFSALPIENYQENGLSFERSFTAAGSGSPWKIYLYKVEPD